MGLANLAALLIPISNYLFCAMPAYWYGQRSLVVVGLACWRSPLGLTAGLVLHLAHGVIGAAVGTVVAWLFFGDATLLFVAEGDGVNVQAAALAGSLGGGLGGLLLAAHVYRRRGAGAAAAGWIGVEPGPALRRASGAAVVLACLAISYNYIFAALFHRMPESASDPMVDFVRSGRADWYWMPLLTLAVVVVAPIMEEVIYRGVIYRAFRDRAGVAIGILMSSLLFALSHYQFEYLVPLWAFGAVLAWIYERSGSLVPVVLTHAFYNGAALLIDMSG